MFGSVTGVSVRHNKGTGILLEGGAVRDYAVTGCRIHNNGIGTSLAGDNFLVSNNVFADNGKHLIDKGGANKLLQGNVFTDNGRHLIDGSGLNKQIRGNVFSGGEAEAKP